MELIKHTINEVPLIDKEVLLLVDVNDMYFWDVGTWTENGWSCSWDKTNYTVVEWYELPNRDRVKEDYSYRQMRLEEFFNEG